MLRKYENLPCDHDHINQGTMGRMLGRPRGRGTPCPGQRPTGSSAHFGVLEGTLPDQESSLFQQAIETQIYDRP